MRYIVIDGYAGVIMGEVEAESPTAAVAEVYQEADPHRDFLAERELIEHPNTWGPPARSHDPAWGGGGVCYDNCAFVHVGSTDEEDRIAVVEMIERR